MSDIAKQDFITIQVPRTIKVSFKLSECEVAKYNGEYKDIEVDLSDLDGNDWVTFAQRGIIIRMQTIRNTKDATKYAWLDAKKIKLGKPGSKNVSSEKKVKKIGDSLRKLSATELAKLKAQMKAAGML